MENPEIYFEQSRNHPWRHGPCSFLDIVYFIKSGFVNKNTLIQYESDQNYFRAIDVEELKQVFNFKEGTHKYKSSLEATMITKNQYDSILVKESSLFTSSLCVIESILDFIFTYTPLYYIRFLNLFGWIRICPKCKEFSLKYRESGQLGDTQQFVRTTYNWDANRNEQAYHDSWCEYHWYICSECDHRSIRTEWKSAKA